MQELIAQPAPRAIDHFWSALYARKRVFIEAILGTLMVNLIGLATSMYSMQVYDRVIPNTGLQTLWVLSGGVAMAILLELVMKQTRAVMVDRACKGIDTELSDLFFSRALGIRMDQRPRTIGTFAAQVRMFESVRTFLTSTTLFLLADVPFAVLFIAVIGLISGPVALVPLLLLPLSMLAGVLFSRPIERLTRENVYEATLKNGLLIESIDGAETIKALGGDRNFIQRWNALTLRMADGELSLKSLSGLSSNLTQLIQQVSYVGMVATGVYAITEGSLTMGGLIACTIISGRALGPIAQIAAILVQWQHAKASLKGLDAILKLPVDGDVPDGRPVAPENCKGELRLEEVKFAYDPGSVALNIQALQIRPGERVAIIGPIGSGKSTLLKLLSGLYQPVSGRVFLDGIDTAHLLPEFLRRHVHYLPQDARLFNGSLRDNLILGCGSDPGDEAVLAACRRTGLDRIIAGHPKGLHLHISEGGQGLSGGQRQLVALTRLLLPQRKLLLLDEPTASIDGPLEEFVGQNLFGSLGPEDSLVMITHKTPLLRHVSRIIVMDRGQIAMDGPRDAVLAKLMQKPNPA